MENAEKVISIKVTIGDRQYPLKIEASEEEFIRQAAKLINEKAKFYEDIVSVKDKQDSQALAALFFTSELAELRKSKEGEKQLLDRKITEFQTLIDQTLH